MCESTREHAELAGMPCPVEPSTKAHWYMEVKCEHGFPVIVEVTPVWVFLPFKDTCPETEWQEKRVAC